MYKQDLALTTWAKILKDFAAAAHDKKYKRIDYRTKWCKIAKPTKSVHIEVQECDISILIDNKTEVIFGINDGTLGEFLYTTFLFKEEKSMPPRNTNSTSAYTVLNSLMASSNVYGDCTIAVSDAAQSNIDLNNYGTAIPYGSQLVVDSDTGTLSYVRSSDAVDIAIATRPTFDDVKQMIKEEINNNKNEENDSMKNIVNFDFGPCTGSDAVRLSVYGIAVKNANGTFVSYDASTQSIMDVDIFNFDGAKFLYKMPVAIKDVKVGDVVIHARKPMFVTDVAINSKSLKVVDPVSGEKKEIILTRSPFGFDFATKIVNILGNFSNGAATSDNPFGNMWMLMLMNEDNSSDSLLPLMLMNQGGSNIDPMMALALMSGKNDNSFLPFLLMANTNNKTCACGGNCSAHKAE